MSYCRFSSDNWRSDVYVYGDADGFTTHVAGNRVVGDIPPEPSWDLLVGPNADSARFAAEHKAVMDWLETAERRPIGGPFDGESFHDPDVESVLERLRNIRAAGYHVPESAIAALTEELASDAAS